MRFGSTSVSFSHLGKVRGSSQLCVAEAQRHTHTQDAPFTPLAMSLKYLAIGIVEVQTWRLRGAGKGRRVARIAVESATRSARAKR